jgi:hypothetical protein
MSEADKMFEELGYKKTGTQVAIKIFCYTKATIKINFYSDKTISATDFGGFYILNMQELKAINQKCKELGWLDE